MGAREHDGAVPSSLALLAVAVAACGGGGTSQFGNGQGGAGASPGSGGVLGSGTTGAGGGVVIGADGGTGQIVATVRDFRFYDPNDPSTDPDFENPPYGLDASGNPAPGGGGNGPWDDRGIVGTAPGTDGKPVYRNAAGRTLTTHGKAAFDRWYHDSPGTNYGVSVPLALTANMAGAYTYDSNVSGVPYNVAGQSGNGFFPIDDGSVYATPFGNQIPATARPPYMGASHNYSFTVEIHTVFTYQGGETFSFRGDDDVFVYINGHLVIDLGGIHGPETASVRIDSLALTIGQSYPLDFFSAERHVTGSNIEFTTTLHLMAAPTLPK